MSDIHYAKQQVRTDLVAMLRPTSRSPQTFFQMSTSSFINSGLLKTASLMRKTYERDVVLHFVSECLNV